uniref:Uncharacterized protein n=1 Tax=Lepeophtheirus salmonis TaxID=72036 RepID=A0A0K2U4G0_LEPSM
MTSCFVNRGLRQSKEDNSKRLVRAGRPLFTPPPTSLMLSPSTSPFVCISKRRHVVSVIKTPRPSKPLSAIIWTPWQRTTSAADARPNT